MGWNLAKNIKNDIYNCENWVIDITAYIIVMKSDYINKIKEFVHAILFQWYWNVNYLENKTDYFSYQDIELHFYVVGI